MQHGVPAVGALAQLRLIQVAEVKTNVRMRARQQGGAHGDDRRQNLRRPEYGLLEEGLIGISCEKPTPSAVEVLHSRRSSLERHSDDRVESPDCGAGTPTQIR